MLISGGLDMNAANACAHLTHLFMVLPSSLHCETFFFGSGAKVDQGISSRLLLHLLETLVAALGDAVHVPYCLIPEQHEQVLVVREFGLSKMQLL
jgi:hypothetical protein